MKNTMTLILIVTLGMAVQVAHADFTFGEPVNIESVIPALNAADDTITYFSSDGLEIYIDSYGSGIWVLQRDSIDTDWAPPENLGPAINSPGVNGAAAISADGLTLYFNSNRPGGHGDHDIYMTTRTTREAPWGQPVNLGPKVNSPQLDAHSCISPDGLELYFISRRTGGYGGLDIYVSRRATVNDSWDDPVNLGSVVNNAYNVAFPRLSPDGLLLSFQDVFKNPPQPGGHGGSDLWMARRATVSSPWQAPVNVGPPVNSSETELCAVISPDGCTLHFCRNSGGIWDNWQAPILPIIDFNDDGIVDAADMCIMIEHWLTDYPLCDIGPMPWGDGIVDVQDLIVLAEYLFEEIPPVE